MYRNAKLPPAQVSEQMNLYKSSCINHWIPCDSHLLEARSCHGTAQTVPRDCRVLATPLNCCTCEEREIFICTFQCSGNNPAEGWTPSRALDCSNPPHTAVGTRLTLNKHQWGACAPALESQPLWAAEPFIQTLWNRVRHLKAGQEVGSWSYVAYTNRPQICFPNPKIPFFPSTSKSLTTVYELKDLHLAPCYLICVFMDSKLFLQLLFTRNV